MEDFYIENFKTPKLLKKTAENGKTFHISRLAEFIFSNYYNTGRSTESV